MKENKNKILVLTDFRTSSSDTLKNTLCIAKKMQADVELFHVKNPLDVFQTENQLSALRSFSSAHNKTNKAFDKLLSTVDCKETKVSYSVAVGRLKKEMDKKIGQCQPTIIVVGKRSRNPLKLSRDGLTNYLLKTASCPILIASSQTNALTLKNLVPAFYNDSHTIFSNLMAIQALNDEYDTIREYRIVSKAEDSDIPIKENVPDKKKVEFLFERNDNAIKTLSNYLVKNNVNLFCIMREDQLNKDLQALIDNVDVSLLITGKHKVSIQ